MGESGGKERITNIQTIALGPAELVGSIQSRRYFFLPSPRRDINFDFLDVLLRDTRVCGVFDQSCRIERLQPIAQKPWGDIAKNLDRRKVIYNIRRTRKNVDSVL